MGVGHQVGLELGDINVQCSIGTKGGSERTDNLSHQTVQVAVSWPLNGKICFLQWFQRCGKGIDVAR